MTHAENSIEATIQIDGMHCASCEMLLEQKLLELQGMKSVSVDFRTGKATLRADASSPPSEKEIERIVKNAGYRIAHGKERVQHVQPTGDADPRKWLEIGGFLIVILAIFKLLSVFNLVSLAPSTTGTLTFGGIFLIGLVAGTSSCLAVTGGLLLAAAAKYNEVNRSQTRWRKLTPLLQFNIGRLVSYFILGGIIGLIGQSIALSPRVTGLLDIVIALVMLSIALSILKILPRNLFGFRPPKALSHWISELAENKHPLAPFTLGGLTFFLPCGFTQSLQLVALASGSFWSGAMTMFVFALGTLPALLSISAISSSATGSASRLFLRFAGTLVLVLGFMNLNSALTLTGFDASSFATVFGPAQTGSAAGQNANAGPALVNGEQDVSMRVKPEGYEPDVITVRAGVPVRWTVDGTDAAGCNGSLVIPSLGIQRILSSGPNVIEFTPETRGRLLFSCSMGMYRGYFNVI